MFRLFGAKDDEEYEAIRSRFTLRGVLDKITCPFLVIVGVDDFVPFPASTAIRLLEELGSEVKKARVIERDNELGGVLHCQKDNLHVIQAEIFNWLNEVLDYRPIGPAKAAATAAARL
jgi:pimeloyl-ACP methyl ester carboxylesterase